MTTRAREVDPFIVDEGRRMRARADLDRVRRVRLVSRALGDGSRQESIAAALGLSQPTVSRIVRQIRGGFDVDEVRPSEVINRYVAGEIDETEMLESILAMKITLGYRDPTGGDGYLRGGWDDLEAALGRGLLSEEQYNLLATKATTISQ